MYSKVIINKNKNSSLNFDSENKLGIVIDSAADITNELNTFFATVVENFLND